MSENSFIQNLTQELKPVRVFKVKHSDHLKALAVGAFSLLAGLSLSGIRADMIVAIQTPQFMIETILLVTLAISSTVTALNLSVPSSLHKKSKYIAVATLVAWLVVILAIFLTGNNFLIGRGFACGSQIILSGILPAFFIFKFANSGAPLQRTYVGWLALTAGAAFGAIHAHLACSLSEPLHVLFWHMIPVFVVGGLGLFVGRKVIKTI